MNKENLNEILDEIVSGIDHDISFGKGYKETIIYFLKDLQIDFKINDKEERWLKEMVYNCFSKEIDKENKNNE